MKWPDKIRWSAFGIVAGPIFVMVFGLLALVFWSSWLLAIALGFFLAAYWSAKVIYQGKFPRRPSA